MLRREGDKLRFDLLQSKWHVQQQPENWVFNGNRSQGSREKCRVRKME